RRLSPTLSCLPRLSRPPPLPALCSRTALQYSPQSAAHPCPCVPSPSAPPRSSTPPLLRTLSSLVMRIAQNGPSPQNPPPATLSRSAPKSAPPAWTIPDSHAAVCKSQSANPIACQLANPGPSAPEPRPAHSMPRPQSITWQPHPLFILFLYPATSPHLRKEHAS